LLLKFFCLNRRVLKAQAELDHQATMGNMTSACEGTKQVVHDVEETFDAQVTSVTDAIKAELVGAAEAAGQVVDQAADDLEDTFVAQVVAGSDAIKAEARVPAEAAEEVVEVIAQTVAEAAEEVQETAGAAHEAAAEVVEASKGAAENALSTMDAAMDAAVAAVTGTMIVDFAAGNNEAEWQVCFKTRKVGFELGMSGGGCCMAKGQGKVIVKTMERAGQAEVLGVKRSCRLKSINGVEVTGLRQARQLLAEHVTMLPEA